MKQKLDEITRRGFTMAEYEAARPRNYVKSESRFKYYSELAEKEGEE